MKKKRVIEKSVERPIYKDPKGLNKFITVLILRENEEFKPRMEQVRQYIYKQKDQKSMESAS